MNSRFLNEITCGDSEQLIQDLDNDSLDLVITSPPYNVDLGFNAKHQSPYDLYQDNKIDNDKKSMSLRMKFQSDERTLKDEEVDVVINKIVDKLQTYILISNTIKISELHCIIFKKTKYNTGYKIHIRYVFFIH